MAANWTKASAVLIQLGLIIAALLGGLRAAYALDAASLPGRIVVDTLNGGKQTVQLNEIWRIRPALASDEPVGATVLDYAQTRLYVANSVNELVATIGRQLPLAELTAPNGKHVYLVATKVTDIYEALSSLHNANTKAIVGTRDGAQQVQETQETALRIIEAAKAAR